MDKRHMGAATLLLREGRRQELWDRYCGFLDLTIDGYMELQKRQLLEQLERLSRCTLGVHILGGRTPRTVDEFRNTTRFTTYKDYIPYLLERDEAALPEKPYLWAHTSGRSGEYDFKWVPYTRRMYELGGEAGLALLMLASAKGRGDVVLKEGMTFPYIIAPPPYTSGIITQRVLEIFNFKVFPPMEAAEKMDFQQRIKEAFAAALSEGLDFFFGVTSILNKISESFSQMGRGGRSGAKLPTSPRALVRLVGALIKSLLKGRPLMPRDIWSVKGALCGGMDTSIFKKRVTESWGIVPLEAYASTEFEAIAGQTWSRGGLTFFPQCNFWEFLAEKDYRDVMKDPAHIPRSRLMDEVEPDTEYVLVGTNFHGGAMVRYILGDLVKIISLEDTQGGVKLPQMTFVSRIDNIIDIGGFTRLTEKTIWQAMEDSGVPYEEWAVKKESQGEHPVLHLYLELKRHGTSAQDAAGAVHESLRKLDAPYRDLEKITGLKPLQVTLLSRGTFQRYFEERQAAGADLAHLKPPHVGATDTMIANLLRMSDWKI